MSARGGGKRTRVRPGRVFADPYDAAVAVEYLAETYASETGEVRGEGWLEGANMPNFPRDE